MARKIQLHGKYSYLFALVDDEDYDEINQYKWYGLKTSNSIYIYTQCLYNSKWTTLFIHRLILILGFDDKRQGDHINHNTLDNQKLNL